MLSAYHQTMTGHYYSYSSSIMDSESTTTSTVASESIAIMCRQEDKEYSTGTTCSHCATTTSPSSPTSVADQQLENDSRSRMASWCFQICDYAKFHRETVSIALNLLDRWTSRQLQQVSRRHYQLAGMTCLYTAIKVHESQALDLLTLTNLAHRTYTEEEFAAMEVDILNALQWRVNPPTALAFCRHFCALLPGMDVENKSAVYEMAKYQTELAVTMNELVSVKASVVALAAMLNALNSLGADQTWLRQVADVCMQATGLSDGGETVFTAQNWLYQAVLQQHQPYNPQAASVVMPIFGGLTMVPPTNLFVVMVPVEEYALAPAVSHCYADHQYQHGGHNSSKRRHRRIHSPHSIVGSMVAC